MGSIPISRSIRLSSIRKVVNRGKFKQCVRALSLKCGHQSLPIVLLQVCSPIGRGSCPRSNLCEGSNPSRLTIHPWHDEEATLLHGVTCRCKSYRVYQCLGSSVGRSRSLKSFVSLVQFQLQAPYCRSSLGRAIDF